MPLTYDKKTESWKTENLTEDEQLALVELGIESIVDSFGLEAAKKIMDAVGIKMHPAGDSPAFFDNRVKGVA